MQDMKEGPALAPVEGTPAPVAAVLGDAKVATAFIKKFKDADLASACARIMAEMAGNPDYPAPRPPLAMLGSVHDAFVAEVNANDGGKRAVVARNQARKALQDVLRELAAYVQQACRGNQLRLLGSGYPAQRPRSIVSTETLPAPRGLKLRRGEASGRVLVRCARVPRARLYQWRFAQVQAPTAWTVEDASSSVAATLDGLVVGAQYLVQVRAYGKRGPSDWSESVVYVVS